MGVKTSRAAEERDLDFGGTQMLKFQEQMDFLWFPQLQARAFNTV